MTAIFPTYTLGNLALTSYPYAVEFGGDHGAPESVTELMQTLLADGDLVTLTRHGNREISLVVHVEGGTLGELANHEATLRAECTKVRNDLVFQPGDIDSPASVFEVFSVSMKQPRDDEIEQHTLRRWELTFTCSPFPRSQEPVEVAGYVAGTTTVTFDTCDSATGWTATTGGVPSAASPAWEAGSVGVAELDDAITSPEEWTLTRTGSVDFTSTPFLVAEVRTIASDSMKSALDIEAFADGDRLRLVAITALPNDSYYRVVWDTTDGVNGARPPGTIGSLTFKHVSPPGHPWQGLFIRELRRTNFPPGHSARQLSRIIEIGGTERTPASIHTETSSGFLGVTMVHTTPHDGSGYTPNMRRWRSSGNTTSTNTDARRITGTWELMRPNPVISRTPAHSMPRGDYLLVAAIKSDTPTTTTPLPIDWALKSVVGGQTIGNDEGTGYGWFPTAHQLTIVPIASFAAPVVRSGALDVEVHLLNPTSTVTLSVEEWWMFTADDDSALSIVNTSEGGLWLDSPNADSPVPTFWVGPSKPLAYHPSAGLIAPGSHTFKPGPLLVTTVSDSNDYLSTDLEYHKRWHSNAAE